MSVFPHRRFYASTADSSNVLDASELADTPESVSKSVSPFLCGLRHINVTTGEGKLSCSGLVTQHQGVKIRRKNIQYLQTVSGLRAPNIMVFKADHFDKDMYRFEQHSTFYS